MYSKKNFEDWLKKSGLRAGYLAEQLGCSSQLFSMKRTGKVRFTAHDLVILLKLGMTDNDADKIFGS